MFRFLLGLMFVVMWGSFIPVAIGITLIWYVVYSLTKTAKPVDFKY